MKSRSEKLNDLLKLEVATKGKIATYAFASVALVAYFYGFGTIRFNGIIKTISIFTLIMTFLRHQFCNQILKNKTITQKDWYIVISLITLNSIGFSIILNLASFESQLATVHYAIITTVLSAVVSASILTLSYYPIIFFPFQVIMLLPQMLIVAYFNRTSSQNLIPLIILYFIYFFYQLKQFLSYRADLIKRFNYQLDLEDQNIELENNKSIIIDQTIKLIHTSRLAVMAEMSIGITHEINNPLTVVSGNLKLIERTIDSQKEKIDHSHLDQIKKYTVRIQSAILRIDKIINGLKYYANPSDNKPKEIVEIKQIINETLSFLEEHLNKNEINFEIVSVPDVKVLCHPVQISQVLINIIKNACDALEENLDRTKKWIKVDFKDSLNSLDIIIQNGGEKIHEDIVKNIFKPFYTTKTNKKGTGLGLSISDTIMKEHEGELECDLNNLYTTFIVRLKKYESLD